MSGGLDGADGLGDGVSERKVRTRRGDARLTFNGCPERGEAALALADDTLDELARRFVGRLRQEHLEAR